MNEDPNQTVREEASNLFYVLGFLFLGGLFFLFVFLYLAPMIGSRDIDENIDENVDVVPDTEVTEPTEPAEQTPIVVPVPELDEPNEDFPDTVPQDPDMNPDNGNTLY